jgi:hypothetical protein
MAKININFNNAEYQIDEFALSAASTELKQHLSTTMSGTGATINLGGTAYNIDSAKLSTATTEFVSHLGTISGSGHKVKVGGVEYGVGVDKVAGAVSELEAVFGGLNSGGGSDDDNIIMFDGNIEGRDTGKFVYYGNELLLVKVSDVDYTQEELKTSEITLRSGTNGELTDQTFSGSMLGWSENAEVTMDTGILMIFSFHATSGEVMGEIVQVPSTGLYVVYVDDPNYDEGVHLVTYIHKIEFPS